MLNARYILAVATLAGIVVASGGWTADGRTDRCHPGRDVQLIAATDNLRLYTNFGEVFICWPTSAEPKLIEGPYVGGAIYPKAGIRRTTVAFVYDVEGEDDVIPRLVIFDARDPSKILRTAPAMGTPSIVKVISADRVAWIACAGGERAGPADPRCRPPGYRNSLLRVMKIDMSTQRDKSDVLSTSRRIEAESLRVRGLRVSWRSNGQTRRRTLR